jgi:hypothetical protein
MQLRNELTSTLSRLQLQLDQIRLSLSQPLTTEQLSATLDQLERLKQLATEAEEKIRLIDSA